LGLRKQQREEDNRQEGGELRARFDGDPGVRVLPTAMLTSESDRALGGSVYFENATAGLSDGGDVFPISEWRVRRQLLGDQTGFDGILPRKLPAGLFRTVAIVGEASRTAFRKTRGRNKEAGF
jgi:hypothetical protein